jgi:uncharacterized protein YyaL (SSP411 family)
MPTDTVHANRLAAEKSPYLLQHAHNPVDWRPWGEEALALAKALDKPIFLSVGYSTCHWCHVMERESFEDEAIARILNDNFVPIKVDREERPEIDDIYMAATQMLTGRGGWPNSVFLTPDGKPWFAGTYFPPEDYLGYPGFRTLLLRLAQTWQKHREQVLEQAERIVQALPQMHAPPSPATAELSRALVDAALAELARHFDRQHGGLAGAPKFPPHGALGLIFHELGRTHDTPLLHLATQTLEAMARGGIRDHLGGGFHRYSTDDRWLVPHFEKMLYDNAQLIRAYCDGFAATGNAQFADAAREACAWVLGEMTAPEGGFFSAVDADSQGQEALGQADGRLFCRVYDVEEAGNFTDAAVGGTTGENIIHLHRPMEVSAKLEDVRVEELRRRMAAAREKLLHQRRKRIPPATDDKVLTDWNALMIGALARAANALREPRYLLAATTAATFILFRMRPAGRLLRSYRDHEARLGGCLDDYAFLADALLDLHQATGEDRWLHEAQALTDVIREHFADPAGGFFFTPDDHEPLIARLKSPFDSAVPSGNAVAIRVLVRLAEQTSSRAWLDVARAALTAFAPAIAASPTSTPTLLHALAHYLDARSGIKAAATAAKAGAPPAAPHDNSHGRSRKKPVWAEVSASGLKVRAGDSFNVTIRLEIDPGWYIHSHAAPPPQIPTTIALSERACQATLQSVAYPPGQTITPDPDGPSESAYVGRVEATATLLVSPSAAPGQGLLEFVIEAQACGEGACRPPQRQTLPMPLEVIA